MNKTMMKSAISSLTLAAMLALTTTFAQSASGNKAEAIRAISNHFSSVPTMTGEFVQFGPRGEQTGGKFYIHRPGKIRFEYEKPSPLMIVSNGKTLGVRNKKLKTWSYTPLEKTPLSLLLASQIKVNDASIKSVDAGEDVTTVVMGDKAIFGDSVITLLFDGNTQDLRQWTIKDAQGKETSVMIFNVQKNVRIPKKLFNLKTAKGRTNNENR